jgi:outer membrane protein TolC
VSINQLSLERTRQQIAFQTRQAFYQFLSAMELLKVAQYNVTLAETQLKVAQATFDAGTAPKLDVFQAQATLADAQVGLARAQNGVDIARATLATQLGLPAGTPVEIQPPAELPTAPAQVEPLVATAISERPELRQLTYRRQQIDANIALIKLTKQPLVNLQAGYNQTLVGGSLFGSNGLSFSANVAFTLYNGGKSRADLAAAQTQLTQITTIQHQTELGVTLDVRQAWLNLQNALQQLIAAAQQNTAAAEAVRIAQLRYNAGEGILLEWQQAALRSTQAQTSLAQARFQALTAAAQLQFAMGTPVTAPAAPAVAP